VSAEAKQVRPGVAHILLVATTNDPSIGRAVKLDNQHMREILTNGLPANRREIRMLEGDAVTHANLFAAIDRFRVQPNDTLFVYFSGHGAYDNFGRHVLALASGRLDRIYLMGRLKARNARLTVLMTDACSGEIPIEPEAAPKLDTRNGVLVSLLLRHAGVVDVNAATRGQLGWCSSSGPGSWFTYVFYRLCREQPFAVPGRVTWQEAWAIVVRETIAYYKMRKRQILANPDVNPVVRDALRAQEEQRPQAYELSARPIRPRAAGLVPVGMTPTARLGR
jgi:hypothetical protein